MKARLLPGPRWGSVQVPASKSQAHRLLICAALGQTECRMECDGISRDIAATADCLRALGAGIRVDPDRKICVSPIPQTPAELCHLRCGESGSTLRFLLPVVGALGAKAVFHMEGRLPQRPLAPLDAQLRAHGMEIRQNGSRLYCGGQLRPGEYSLPGNVSSQYISGLLMALPLLGEESRLTVTEKLESAAYVTMTEDALRMASVGFEKEQNGYRIPGNQRFEMPVDLQVEADYSNGAFFLCMGALSTLGVQVKGLSPASSQGDRAILDILRRFGAEIEEENGSIRIRRGQLRAQVIDAAPIPDLIPVLSVVAAAAEGETRIENAGRLRLKESDRLASTSRLLRDLGADVEELPEGLIIRGKESLRGGCVDSWGDHRIAMSAAVAACLCREPVLVQGAECVEKSYPRFWNDFEGLAGGEP